MDRANIYHWLRKTKVRLANGRCEEKQTRETKERAGAAAAG